MHPGASCAGVTGASGEEFPVVELFDVSCRVSHGQGGRSLEHYSWFLDYLDIKVMVEARQMSAFETDEAMRHNLYIPPGTWFYDWEVKEPAMVVGHPIGAYPGEEFGKGTNRCRDCALHLSLECMCSQFKLDKRDLVQAIRDIRVMDALSGPPVDPLYEQMCNLQLGQPYNPPKTVTTVKPSGTVGTVGQNSPIYPAKNRKMPMSNPCAEIPQNRPAKVTLLDKVKRVSG